MKILSSCRSGFEKAAKNFTPKELDNVSLKGRVALVTGANSGIGYCCALALARSGAEVHIVCRNVERAEEARRCIAETTNNPVSQ